MEEGRLRILAVDDDPNDLRYVRDTLVRSGYDPVVTGEPEEALRLVAEEKPELVLLDLMLPGTDGIELMQDVLDVADVPVIFLSVYGREELIARAFDMGAADYVVKPFSPTELSARIRAALRRREAAEPSEPYVYGDLTVDYAGRSVSLAGRPVRLTPIEYRVLAELSANAGRVMTYERMLSRVWREKSDGDVRPMRTIVGKLRRKLGDDADNPTYIFTEPRVGFGCRRGRRRAAIRLPLRERAALSHHRHGVRHRRPEVVAALVPLHRVGLRLRVAGAVRRPHRDRVFARRRVPDELPPAAALGDVRLLDAGVGPRLPVVQAVLDPADAAVAGPREASYGLRAGLQRRPAMPWRYRSGPASW